MKKCLFSLLIFFCLSLWAQNQAKLYFYRKTIDMGEFVCKDDSIIKINFVFSNNGNVPLIIHKVTVSCGCITPKWPKKPIKSGERSIICIEFKTRDRHGIFAKDIFVESNAVERVILLRIKGSIKKK